MTISDIEHVLCNPTKILRRDMNNNIETFKIEGGSKRHRLAVEISGQDIIIVITAMD